MRALALPGINRSDESSSCHNQKGLSEIESSGANEAASVCWSLYSSMAVTMRRPSLGDARQNLVSAALMISSFFQMPLRWAESREQTVPQKTIIA